MIITVVGNDNRQIELAKLFNKKYDTIYLGGNEDEKVVNSIFKISDVVVFPLPFTRDNKIINNTKFDITNSINSIPKSSTIFAGLYKSKRVIDYNDDEEFTLKNAFYTAETALALSIINTPFSLSTANVLVLGNGRIGKALGTLLTPLCKTLSVSARKQIDFDYLNKRNINSINTENIDDLSSFDVIFNTIPQTILSEKSILTINKNALIIDLASKNSLLCNADANYIDAKSLPAQYCMQSSAKALYEFINKHLTNKIKIESRDFNE